MSKESGAPTTVVRVPTEVHSESKRMAELRGTQQSDLLAVAWREYLERHKDEFAADLEAAAKLLRDGSIEDLAAFASRNAKSRGATARERALAKAKQTPA